MYFLYSRVMPSRPMSPKTSSPDTISLKIGGWFEAHATGKGVIAIPFVIVVLAVAAGLKVALG
jgi:hypothetical protein